MDSTVTHIEISNPDDPMGMPLYDGDPRGAATMLVPGTYRAYAHRADGTEGAVTVTIGNAVSITVA